MSATRQQVVKLSATVQWAVKLTTRVLCVAQLNPTGLRGGSEECHSAKSGAGVCH